MIDTDSSPDQSYLPLPDYAPAAEAYDTPPVPHAITGQSLPEDTSYSDTAAYPYGPFSMNGNAPPSLLTGERITGSSTTLTGIGHTLLSNAVEARHRQPGSEGQQDDLPIEEIPEDTEPPDSERAGGKPPIPPEDVPPPAAAGEPEGEGDGSDDEDTEDTMELPVIGTGESEQVPPRPVRPDPRSIAEALGGRFEAMLTGGRAARKKIAADRGTETPESTTPEAAEETQGPAAQTAKPTIIEFELGPQGVKQVNPDEPEVGDALTRAEKAELEERRARGDRAADFDTVPPDVLERVAAGLRRDVPGGQEDPTVKRRIEDVEIDVTDEEIAAAGGRLQAIGDKLAGLEPGAVKPPAAEEPDEERNAP